jgi:hypothetical protein
VQAIPAGGVLGAAIYVPGIVFDRTGACPITRATDDVKGRPLINRF